MRINYVDNPLRISGFDYGNPVTSMDFIDNMVQIYADSDTFDVNDPFAAEYVELMCRKHGKSVSFCWYGEPLDSTEFYGKFSSILREFDLIRASLNDPADPDDPNADDAEDSQGGESASV